MIIFMENPKESIKNLMERIREFTKLKVKQDKIQKSVVFLNTSNEVKENEMIQNSYMKI